MDRGGVDQPLVWAGCDLLNQGAENEWLSTVGFPWMENPTAFVFALERQVSTDSEEQELVRNAPIVAHADGRLDPNQA